MKISTPQGKTRAEQTASRDFLQIALVFGGPVSAGTKGEGDGPPCLDFTPDKVQGEACIDDAKIATHCRLILKN